MSHDTELDRILASLAKPLGRLSDTLLDLREWALSPCRAGSCVKAYFDLVGEAPDAEEVARSLTALRKWLEARLNILVFDGNRAVCLETLPLALADETDLGEFCHGAMQRLREDRCHEVPHLRLEFGFSRNFGAAA
ncbi:MAG: hypothetical protein V4819_11710 [Verrucomicrobiota bacterium]